MADHSLYVPQDQAFKALIRRYADGRPICNCGLAYYSPCGHAWVPDGKGGWTERTDYPSCQYGCEVNQYNVKFEVARRALAELEATGVTSSLPPSPAPSDSDAS